MRGIIGRLFSIVLVAGGWILVGVRTVLDLIGYATLPDDAVVAQSRLDQLFLWTLGLPWWAVWSFALISTLWLMWVSWPNAHFPRLAGRKAKYRGLGYSASLIAMRFEESFRNTWIGSGESQVSIIRDANSLLYTFAKHGFHVPIFTTSDIVRISASLENYFANLAPLLKDGHIKEARRNSQAFSEAAVQMAQSPPDTGSETQP